jgi:hypothetical protein
VPAQMDHRCALDLYGSAPSCAVNIDTENGLCASCIETKATVICVLALVRQQSHACTTCVAAEARGKCLKHHKYPATNAQNLTT